MSEFKPQDFALWHENVTTLEQLCEAAAKSANAKLAEIKAAWEKDVIDTIYNLPKRTRDELQALWLSELKASATVVLQNEYTDWYELRDGAKESGATHRALLICVEEIAKKPCEHEPRYIDQSYKLPDVVVCKHCGVKLKASWSVVE